MIRFMMLTFAVLGWSFYELSGGSDFVPETASAQSPVGVNEVSRADTSALDLLAVNAVAEKPARGVTPRKAALPAGVQLASLSADEPVIAPSYKPATNKVRSATKLVLLDAAKPDSVQPAVAVLSDRDVELRTVSGDRVNMRNGPGTNYSVLGKLTRGTSVEILQDNGDGWVKLRASDTGRVGWMADFLLSSAD